MGKLNIPCIFIFYFMISYFIYFDFFFGGENEGHKIVQIITFGFSKFVFQEKGIHFLDFGLYFRHLSVQNALPLYV